MILLSTQKLLKLVDECQQYSKLNHRRLRHCTEKTISGVHVSQGSAETLVRRGGIRHTCDSVLSEQKLPKLVDAS